MIKYKLKTTALQYEAAGSAVPQESKPKVLSVTELTRNIKLLLETSFQGVWVEGEISNFKHHTSGHFYFCIKDAGAQANCVMFRRENASIGFEPADGMQVLCFVRVSVYEPRGQYQLYVERIEPKGVGALQMRFEALKQKLRLEGLFDEARKRPIPFLPARIALVTSTDGAALRDILHVLGRRFSHVHILIYPVAVQGAQAAPLIAEALEDLAREEAADVIILARGGGSLEDLWAFNEEIVARAIAGCGIPVISAVGHETDFTIADFVADLRAATPSAAAELVLPLREDLMARILELKARASQAMRSTLDESRERLDALKESRVLKDPLAAFETVFQRLDEVTKNLGAGFRRFLEAKREKAGYLMGKLQALGPLETLKRGFSVTLKHPEGTLVSSARTLKPGNTVKTRFKDGFILSRVTEVGNG